ncbi:MAG: O-antigen ligase family protein [bacterium]
MFIWLLFLIAYLPFQIALNPGAGFDLSSLRVFIIVLTLAFFFKNIISRTRYNPHLKNLQSIGLLVFLFLIGFSLISAENISWGLRKILFFLSIFPLYFLVNALVDDFTKIKKTFLILAYSSGLIALIGLLQFLSQFVFGLEKVYDFWAINILPVFSGFNLGALILSYPSWLVNINGNTILRAFSVFSDPHIFSFYLGMILPLIIVLLNIKKEQKIIFYTLFFLLFSALLLSFVRGAYLAIIIAFLVMAGLFWKYLKDKKTAIFLCLCLLIFIIPITPVSGRFYNSFDLEEGSNVGRLEMWQKSGQIGLNNFWQGVGLGNYSLLVDSDLGYRNPITAHNLYLDIFSETGIFALIVCLVLILGTIWQLFKALKSAKNKELAYVFIGLIGVLAYFSVHSFFETAIYSPIVLALLMIILGLSLRIKSAS